jgi:hypothetical protein
VNLNAYFQVVPKVTTHAVVPPPTGAAKRGQVRYLLFHSIFGKRLKLKKNGHLPNINNKN